METILEEHIFIKNQRPIFRLTFHQKIMLGQIAELISQKNLADSKW